MSINLSELNNVQEILYQVFTFCSPRENIKNTEVCTTWYQVASEVAKKQIIIFAQADILRKASNFLKLVPQNLAFYCLSFAELEKAKLNWSNYSIQEINEKALSTTEKHTVCIASFYTINPVCPNIPLEKKADLAGKTFVELHYKRNVAHPNNGQPYTAGFWEESVNSLHGLVKLFPIEIFDLSLSGQDNAVVGEKNNGSYCFALRGRLIELKLEEGEEDVRNASWTGLNLNRENAVTVDLTPVDANEGNIWPTDLYIARLDAAGSKINSNN